MMQQEQGTFTCLLCGSEQLSDDYKQTEWGQYLAGHVICFDCGERLQYNQLPPHAIKDESVV
jgi:transcription elongation factor Elf1